MVTIKQTFQNNSELIGYIYINFEEIAVLSKIVAGHLHISFEQLSSGLVLKVSSVNKRADNFLPRPLF